MATSLVSSFLIPLLKKGAESLGTELGERTTQSVADGLVGTAQRLWDRVKGTLQSRDDQDIVAIFERQPEVMQEALEKLVLRKLEQDEGFRREVAQLLEAEAEPGVASWQLMGEIVGAVDARHLARIGEAAEGMGYRAVGCDDPIVLERTTRLIDVRRVRAALLGREDDAPGGNEDEQAVFALLDGARPAIVAIDGYSPSTTLAMWFTGRLIPHLHTSQAPLVLVITDRVEALAGLCEIADEVIELGPLDRQEVSRHLRSIGRGLRPPLSDEEVAAYCEAAASDPSVLTALGEVFSVLAAGG